MYLSALILSNGGKGQNEKLKKTLQLPEGTIALHQMKSWVNQKQKL